MQTKRPHLACEKIIFHQVNAPAHKAVKTMTKLTELKYELLPLPPCSPDLAPWDYYSFPNLKRWLAGKRFYSNEEVIVETNAYFEELSADYYKRGNKLLETRWNKCIELEVLNNKCKFSQNNVTLLLRLFKRRSTYVMGPHVILECPNSLSSQVSLIRIDFH